MGFCEIVGLIFILYSLFYLIFPWFLDSDIELAFYEKWGRPIESLRGKVVWITGASSGIGEHLAYTLARVGCKLILSARRKEELEEIKNKCLRVNASLKESDVEVLVMDVSKTELHKELFDHVISKFGKVQTFKNPNRMRNRNYKIQFVEQLDILVNNAGRTQRAVWEKIDNEVDRQIFDLNTFAVISLSRLAVKHFLDIGQGQLAFTSSIAGIIGIPFSGSYTGSKHAVHGYLESLRTEKGHNNIPITIICPGPIQTNFLPQSFTEKAGEKFGRDNDISKSKLSPSRCSKLIAVAIANKLHESWIGTPKLIHLVYLMKYYPNVGKLIMSYVGPTFIQKLRDTKVTVKAK